MAAGNFVQDPLNAAVSQGGFSRERGGNLRDHNGARPNEAAIAATTHYDGDYGTTGASTPPPMNMTRATDVSGGADVSPSGGTSSPGAVATQAAPTAADSSFTSGGTRGGSTGAGGLSYASGPSGGGGVSSSSNAGVGSKGSGDRVASVLKRYGAKGRAR